MHPMQEIWSSRRNALLGEHQHLDPLPWNHHTKTLSGDYLNFPPVLCPAQWWGSPAVGDSAQHHTDLQSHQFWGCLHIAIFKAAADGQWQWAPLKNPWHLRAERFASLQAAGPSTGTGHGYRDSPKTALYRSVAAWFCLFSWIFFFSSFIFPTEMCEPLLLQRRLTESKLSHIEVH